MSRGTTRPTQRRAERRHPSKFFFVALAIGLALLIWLFVFAVRHPTKPQRTTHLIWSAVAMRPL